MEFNLTTIFILFGVLILGWFIGFLDSNLRSSKKIKAAETAEGLLGRNLPAAG